MEQRAYEFDWLICRFTFFTHPFCLGFQVSTEHLVVNLAWVGVEWDW